MTVMKKLIPLPRLCSPFAILTPALAQDAMRFHRDPVGHDLCPDQPREFTARRAASGADQA